MGITITVNCNKCKKEIDKEYFKVDPQNEKAINFIKKYPKTYGWTLCKKCQNLWEERRIELDKETKDKLKSFLDD